MVRLLPSVAATLALTSTALAQQLCNGKAEYCDRIWSNVSQVASHDSPFVGDLPTQNQHSSVADQLSSGIRFLQGQTHKDVFGNLNLCHTSCWEEDAGSLTDYLATIKTFLDNNADEVLTLLLTNGDNVDVSMFDGSFNDAGIKDYTFVPSSSPSVLPVGDWPTLRDIISSGKRLVVFLDYGADVDKVNYIMDEFAYFFESPFSPTDFSSCAVDRPPNTTDEGKMGILNHNLNDKIGDILIPDTIHIDETNAATGSGSIGEHVALCVGLHGKAPKGVLLDYVDKGDPFAAERAMNGL